MFWDCVDCSSSKWYKLKILVARIFGDDECGSILHVIESVTS